MREVPTSIAGAAFLAEPGFLAVIAAVAVEGDLVRVVGGAVRNTLIGEAVADVDVATTARPETVMARAAAAGLKPVPTGIEHGTVTVVADGHPYEVTTLRADVETDGRRAVVAFTDDWTADAGRRDFTMNAIYAEPDGTLFDPTGGIADALAGRVRFIGRAEERIREDYLRILRFFRFHARYGRGAPDPDGLAACVALQAGMDLLSRERIGAEMRKLVLAPRAAETIRIMQETGILERVLGAPGFPDRFERMAALVGADHRARLGDRVVPAALAVLAAEAPDDADRLSERLRLSRIERDGVALISKQSRGLGAEPDEMAVKRGVYRDGNAVTLAALIHAAAREGAALPRVAAVAARWAAPRFPLTGKDLLAVGMAPGPEVGRRLKELEEAWIEGGFGERKGS